MKKLIGQIINGKDNRINGLIALGVVLSIALGCNCGKTFDINNTSSSSNSTSDNPFSTNSSSSNTSTTRTGESKPDASKGAMPADGEIQYLVRETLLSFNNALQTEDFSSFYSNISTQWKKETSAESMKASFKSFIDGEADISEISDMTAVIDNKKTRKAGRNNFIDVKGKYDTSGIDTTFDLSYVAEGADWKLTKIEIYTGVKRR